MTSVTFYVIRAIKDNDNGRGLPAADWSYENPWAFRKGWFASREFVKPFKHAKFFTTAGNASRFLKSASTLGFGLIRSEYFEIVPVIVNEPE